MAVAGNRNLQSPQWTHAFLARSRCMRTFLSQVSSLTPQACSKNDRRSCVSEDLRRSTTELRRSDLHQSRAGGTRTHDFRLLKHVLQLGSRSLYRWRRGVDQTFPEGNRTLRSTSVLQTHWPETMSSGSAVAFFVSKQLTRCWIRENSLLYQLSYNSAWRC